MISFHLLKFSKFARQSFLNFQKTWFFFDWKATIANKRHRRIWNSCNIFDLRIFFSFAQITSCFVCFKWNISKYLDKIFHVNSQRYLSSFCESRKKRKHHYFRTLESDDWSRNISSTWSFEIFRYWTIVEVVIESSKLMIVFCWFFKWIVKRVTTNLISSKKWSFNRYAISQNFIQRTSWKILISSIANSLSRRFVNDTLIRRSKIETLIKTSTKSFFLKIYLYK